MILAIDVGNSNIVLGCIEDGEIRTTARISTAPERTEDEYAMLIGEILSLRGVDVSALEGAILSSVVWPLNTTLSRAAEMLTGKLPLPLFGVQPCCDLQLQKALVSHAPAKVCGSTHDTIIS